MLCTLQNTQKITKMKININRSSILVPLMVETTGLDQETKPQGVQILYLVPKRSKIS